MIKNNEDIKQSVEAVIASFKASTELDNDHSVKPDERKKRKEQYEGQLLEHGTALIVTFLTDVHRIATALETLATPVEIKGKIPERR